MINLNQYLTVEQMSKKYPTHFPVNVLRWLVVKKHDYGLAHAIVKIGKRLYFNEAIIIEWVASGGSDQKIRHMGEI